MCLFRFADKGFRIHVNTCVNHLKSRTLQHHSHQVLADIMKITFYGTDNSLSYRLISHFHQLGLQNSQPCIHGSRSYKNLRYEYFVVLKFCSDNHHA